MKISRNSWHYKLLKKLPISPMELGDYNPKDICEYLSDILGYILGNLFFWSICLIAILGFIGMCIEKPIQIVCIVIGMSLLFYLLTLLLRFRESKLYKKLKEKFCAKIELEE